MPNLIREGVGKDLHSLWFNANYERANTILGPDFHLWCGPESVVERFGGAAVHYPPGAFGQSNLEIAQLIIEHVRERIRQVRALPSSTRAWVPLVCRFSSKLAKSA